MGDCGQRKVRCDVRGALHSSPNCHVYVATAWEPYGDEEKGGEPTNASFKL